MRFLGSTAPEESARPGGVRAPRIVREDALAELGGSRAVTTPSRSFHPQVEHLGKQPRLGELSLVVGERGERSGELAALKRRAAAIDEHDLGGERRFRLQKWRA